MRRAPARGFRRATAVLGLVGVVGLLTLASPEAASGFPRSTADTSDVRITVTTLTPTSLDPDGTLVIAGRVVNASNSTLEEVGARLRVGTSPLVARGELATFASAAGPPEVGVVPVASLVDVTPQLAPGEAADVRIEVPAPQLGLTGGFGVHPLTLEIRVADPSGLRRTAGTARTFVVAAGTGSAPTVRVAWVWPLVGTPGRGVDGILSADAATELATELRPDGRLGGLLDAGAGQPVTWFVDGALLEDVRSVATGNGLPEDLQPDPVAASWLSTLALEHRRPGSDVVALPYADPDVVAVQRAGLQRDLRSARRLGVATTGALLGGPVDAAPSWPANGLSNRPTLQALEDQGADSVLLTSAALEPSQELTATPDALADLAGFPDLGLVTSDAGLSALVGAGPSGLGGLVLATQRVLAETAMIAAERPSDPRSVVATPPRRWSASPEWAAAVAGATAPWLEAVTLDSLAADPGDAPTATTSPYPPEARDAEVSAVQLATVAEDRARLERFAPAVADPEAFLAGYDPALLSAQSASWRGKGAEAGREFTAALTTQVGADVTSVRLVPRGQVTLSSRAGIIPLAVQNSLDQDVRIRVRITATPSVRLRSTATEVITVPAGRTASVDVAAEATVDATFPVVAVLLTEDGTTIGQPVAFTVRATGYGQAARIVVGGALVLLAVAVVVRVARRIRTARAAEGGSLDP